MRYSLNYLLPEKRAVALPKYGTRPYVVTYSSVIMLIIRYDETNDNWTKSIYFTLPCLAQGKEDDVPNEDWTRPVVMLSEVMLLTSH